MKPESLVFAAAGTLFGLIAGWVIGSQQAAPSAPVPVAEIAQPAPASTPEAQAPPPLDEAEVQKYLAIAEADPDNVTPRVRLGNLYFDAERYQDAIQWYEAALTLDSTDANVSTDLGVAYYYVNQPDKALQQFEHSLDVDPAHTKTMLNMGIVRAFGKQDLEGAADAWERVLALAPESPEGQAAKRALEAMRSAHPTLDGAGASPGTE
jgi:tetratricopeptide (TPR) repeat protein